MKNLLNGYLLQIQRNLNTALPSFKASEFVHTYIGRCVKYFVPFVSPPSCLLFSSFFYALSLFLNVLLYVVPTLGHSFFLGFYSLKLLEAP